MPGDGHILLLSSGFLDLLPPASAASLAQHFPTSEVQGMLNAAAFASGRNAGAPNAVPVGSRADQRRKTSESRSGGYFEETDEDTMAASGQRGSGSEGFFNVSQLLASYAASRANNTIGG